MTSLSQTELTETNNKYRALFELWREPENRIAVFWVSQDIDNLTRFSDLPYICIGEDPIEGSIDLDASAVDADYFERQTGGPPVVENFKVSTKYIHTTVFERKNIDATAHNTFYGLYGQGRSLNSIDCHTVHATLKYIASKTGTPIAQLPVVIACLMIDEPHKHTKQDLLVGSTEPENLLQVRDRLINSPELFSYKVTNCYDYYDKENFVKFAKTLAMYDLYVRADRVVTFNPFACRKRLKNFDSYKKSQVKTTRLKPVRMYDLHTLSNCIMEAILYTHEADESNWSWRKLSGLGLKQCGSHKGYVGQFNQWYKLFCRSNVNTKLIESTFNMPTLLRVGQSIASKPDYAWHVKNLTTKYSEDEWNTLVWNIRLLLRGPLRKKSIRRELTETQRKFFHV